MSDRSAYSECLSVLEAKKILALMQKNGKSTEWTNWSGEGGSEIEIKLENVAASELENIRLPDFCTSFCVDELDTRRSKHDIPEVILMGGNHWSLPEYGDEAYVSVTVFVEEIAEFVKITLIKNSGERHYSRSYNYSCSYHVQLAQGYFRPNLTVPSSFEGMIPDAAEVDHFFSNLWQRYALPDERDSGWLETRRFTGMELGFIFEIDCFDAIHARVREMVVDLIAKSPCDQYVQRSRANIGSAASVEGEIHNVTELGQELLGSIAKHNSYASYDVRYYYLGPCTWKDREKLRKKWKEPTSEQLGKVRLENGAVAGVSLGIEKEGYVFYLDFASDDDVIKFSRSKLFKKTKWHSGAE